MSIGLVVSLNVKPEKRAEFLAAAEDDSTSSVRDEPGCLRFDVLEDSTDPNHFYFYEVYESDEAFRKHAQTPHYARWQKAREACVTDSGRQEGEVLFPAPYR